MKRINFGTKGGESADESRTGRVTPRWGWLSWEVVPALNIVPQLNPFHCGAKEGLVIF